MKHFFDARFGFGLGSVRTEAPLLGAHNAPRSPVDPDASPRPPPRAERTEMSDLKIEEPRELVGRMVRQVWVEWAREQDNPKPSWLLPWEEIEEGQREVDMRIGEALFTAGRQAGVDATLPPSPVSAATGETGEETRE